MTQTWNRFFCSNNWRPMVRSNLFIVHIQTTPHKQPCRFLSSRDTQQTTLLHSFQQVLQDIRTKKRETAVLQRDTVSYLTRQYTELPAILSQPHGACQRLEILQCLSNEHFNKDEDSNKPLYSTLADRFLETATADTLRFLLASRADTQTYLAYARRSSQQSVNHDQQQRLEHPSDPNHAITVTALDQNWRTTLAMWFSPSVLLAKRIRYDQTPAAVIERIVRKEAVHPVQGWTDLHNRFGPHRRVYALVHPFLLDRPLVVIHVSLQATHIPDSMRAIHDAPPTEQPTVAAFYSISNLERGLAGIGLGEVLIAETVNLLRGEFPSLQEFVTLSPMPHFRKWLAVHHPAFQQELAGSNTDGSTTDNSTSQEQTLRLHQLAMQYIVAETLADTNKPLDPVARFHLSNGAEVHRVLTHADPSSRGQQNSFGVMVNYRYDLSRRLERKGRYAQNPRDFDVGAAIHNKRQ